jgi:hypothetical protein
MSDDTKIDFEAQCAQNLERGRSVVADFWQANAAYWQTVADIMGARAATASNWWQALPQQFQALAQAQGWPAVMEQFSRWQQQNWLAAWHLNVDTLHQRSHLWDEWQALAQRNGLMPKPKEAEKPVVKSSYFAANPQAQAGSRPQAAGGREEIKAKPVAASQPTSQAGTHNGAAAPSNGYVPQPAGTFIPGPVKKIVASATPAAPEEPQETNGHTAAEPARNAAQAATLAGATSARRSVIASHRSRAARRTH